MEGWLALAVLVCAVPCIAVVERCLAGTWFTPVNVLAGPFTLVLFLAFTVGARANFVTPHPDAVLTYLAGILLFWSGGLVVTLATGDTISLRADALAGVACSKEAEKFIFILTWLCILILIRGLLSSLAAVGSGLAGLAGEEFQTLYGMGIYGWTRVLLMLLSVYWIGTVSPKRIIMLATMLVSFLLLMVFQVKTLIFITLAGGIYYRMLTGRLAATLAKAVLATLMAFFVFNLTYSVYATSQGAQLLVNVSWYEHLMDVMMHYLFAGVLSFSEELRLGMREGDPSVLFYPLVNLYSRLAGTYDISTRAQDVSIFFRMISYKPYFSEGSNVHTLIGMPLMYIGYAATALYLIVLGMVSYLLFLTALLSRSPWITSVLAFFGGMLALAWFDNFFYHLFVYQILVFGPFMHVLTHLYSRFVKIFNRPEGHAVPG